MKRLSRSITLAVIALALAAFATGCSGSSGGYGGSNSATPASPSTTASSAPTSASTVTIANFAFAPTPVEVAVGGTVTWTNEDSTTHQLLGDGGIKSGPLAQGATYSQTFAKAGSYTYHCTIHPSMIGTVVVK